MSKSSGSLSHPSTPWEKAIHDHVDCFSRLPISFLNKWQQKLLPLYHTEQHYPPVLQTGPSISQVVVPDSTTPTGDVIVPPHHTEHCYPPESQTGPSTSQAVVPYSTTPMGDVLVPPHHTEHCYPPELQTGPSTSRAVVNCPITPMDDMRMSSLPNSSVPTRAEDDRNCDPQSPPALCKEISNLDPVTSSGFQRYGRGFKSDKIYCDSFPIRPLLMTFMEPELPNQWVTFTHPDGAPYFLDDSRKIPILTDVWMYNADSRTKLETYIEQIFSYIEKYNIEIPEETCLVLEFTNSGRYGYYFVNHATRCLFWLDECNGMNFLGKVKVKYTPSHIGLEMKSLYWLHNYLFPNLCPLPSSAISEIKDILIHAVGDSLTSSRGLASYRLEDLQKMLDLVNTIEASNSAQGELAAGSIAIISRFLQNFHHERFLHLHGQINARLNRGQSIHPERQRPLLMRLMSFLLFYGPVVYLRKLRKITVDGLVNDFMWKDLLGQLTADWKEFTLYAGVLLNANVAFLAIPAPSAESPTLRWEVITATYLSIATSIGAIVLGLLLVKIHNTSLDVTFIVNRSTSRYGLENLAFMYSLPYALFMQALFFFLVAFSFTAGNDAITIITLTWAALGLWVLYCLIVSVEIIPLLRWDYFVAI
ncbi:hypothetical protein BYT27DRAFT_7334293 [Phlegmacium glaucopus]|nr:hypothetical protein BYT27DRAFT_7334293 [Phlegmacium glaucopus]